METAFRVVVTNTTPVSAYRGAGRPEATAAIERAVDLFAAEIGMDPAEVRRRNLIPAGSFPCTTASGCVYDSGDYVRALDAVLDGAGYRALREEQARRRERGDILQLGLGLASYVEITAADAAAGETARLVVHQDGSATVYTGSSAHGQGHHTAWAMLVQSELSIPMARVTVIHGDTDAIPVGVGTYADAGTGIWQVRGDPATGQTCHLGVRHIDMPVTPRRVWTAISAAREARKIR